MVKSYNELLREVVREMKERNMYHKMVSFEHPFDNLANSVRWLVATIPYYNSDLGLEKSFGNLEINVGIKNKLTSKEEANRIKTDILFRGIKYIYPDKRIFLSTFSLHYTKITDDDYKHKNRNEMFYMIHGGTVVASIGSIMLICLINSIFGIYCAIGFTSLLILNILVIIINLLVIMKKNIIFC